MSVVLVVVIVSTVGSGGLVVTVAVVGVVAELGSGSVSVPGIDGSVVTVVTPPPPVENLSGGFSGANWQVQFTSRTNWLYTLERTTNLTTWTTIATSVNGGTLTSSGAFSVTDPGGSAPVAVTVVDSVTAPASGKRWMRVKISQL